MRIPLSSRPLPPMTNPKAFGRACISQSQVLLDQVDSERKIRTISTWPITPKGPNR